MAILLVVCVSCAQTRMVKLVRSGGVRMELTIPEETEDECDLNSEEIEVEENAFSGEPFLMNAIRDEETGEMVATDILTASSVTARFRNVAERAGFVTIGFDINIPSAMADSRFCLKLYPEMIMSEDTVALEPLLITGSKYRENQLRGYERYRRFIASIVTDTTDLIRIGQLEIFLKRHFPETYMMKKDSSIVSDPLAQTLFGATQEEALRHYARTIRRYLNDRRLSRQNEIFRKYVKDPIEIHGIRLDTVLCSDGGDFTYCYSHTFRTRPSLRKVIVSINGFLYADGVRVAVLPKPEDLTFYISSLSSLVDDTPRYKIMVIERQVFDNLKSYLDFDVGSFKLDTNRGNNASELMKIKNCVANALASEELILDSLLVTASCSPEGLWRFNSTLSEKRSNAILEVIRSNVPDDLKGGLRISKIPENWAMLRSLIEKDTVMRFQDRKSIMSLIDDMKEPDRAEAVLRAHPQYSYIKENLFPKLRCVTFDFHLHRNGMVKDTVHTTELDSVYMSGLKALIDLEYKSAVDLLRPYADYNAALALVSADLNYSALELLCSMERKSPKISYLMAVVLARLERYNEALRYYKMSIEQEPSMRHRANLDPELSTILMLNN